MFDAEGINEFPSTGMIMDAILRKQRELPWIFGNVMKKEGITDDEPSTTAGDDIKREIFRKMFGKEEFEEDITDDESSTSTKNEEAHETVDEQEVVFEEEETKKITTDDGSSVLTNKRTLKSNIEDQEKNTTYSWPPTSSKEAFTYRSRSQSKKSEKDFLIWSGERMKIFNQNKYSNLSKKKVTPKPKSP